MLAWIEVHAGLAAWLQGAGTLLALALTVWATYHSTAVARHLANSKTEQFIRMIEDVAVDTERASTPFGEDYMVATVLPIIYMQQSQGVLPRLLAMPIENWPSPALFRAALRLDSNVTFMMETLKGIRDRAGLDLDTWLPGADREDIYKAKTPRLVLASVREDVLGARDEVLACAAIDRKHLGFKTRDRSTMGSYRLRRTSE